MWILLPKENICIYLKMRYKRLVYYEKINVPERYDAKGVTSSPMYTCWSMNKKYVITATI